MRRLIEILAGRTYPNSDVAAKVFVCACSLSRVIAFRICLSLQQLVLVPCGGRKTSTILHCSTFMFSLCFLILCDHWLHSGMCEKLWGSLMRPNSPKPWVGLAQAQNRHNGVLFYTFSLGHWRHSVGRCSATVTGFEISFSYSCPVRFSGYQVPVGANSSRKNSFF